MFIRCTAQSTSLTNVNTHYIIAICLLLPLMDILYMKIYIQFKDASGKNISIYSCLDISESCTVYVVLERKGYTILFNHQPPLGCKSCEKRRKPSLPALKFMASLGWIRPLKKHQQVFFWGCIYISFACQPPIPEALCKMQVWPSTSNFYYISVNLPANILT